MIRLDKRIELVMSRVKIHIKKPETQAEIRYRRHFPLAYRPHSFVTPEKSGQCQTERLRCQTPMKRIDRNMLPKAHYIIGERAISKEIKVKKGNLIPIEVKVLWQEVVMTDSCRQTG